MQIAGIHKNSFVDYPGRIAAVIFTRGCNMDCWYCHNRHLINSAAEMNKEEILEFLYERKNFLNGVVLTGGEPLLQEGVLDFLCSLKQTGLPVKLDTNGSFPEVIESAIKGKLLDYIAMDIKAPYEKYSLVTPVFDIASVKKSARLIMRSGINYEFRTTFAPNLIAEDIENIAEEIKGAEKYCIQQFKKSEGMRAKIAPEPHGLTEIAKAETLARKYIENVIVRGAY